MRLATKVVAMGLLGVVSLLFSRAGAAPDDQAGRSAQAEGLVLARCGLCHSTDLITQQRLDRSRWQATVGKMVRWGAELSEEEAALLVEFLAARFHQAAPASVTLSEIGAAEPLQAEHPPCKNVRAEWRSRARRFLPTIAKPVMEPAPAEGLGPSWLAIPFCI